MKNIILFILFMFLLSSCMKMVDFYIGIPLQPKFDENSFVPGLNIFGIIRTDSTNNFNNSFIQVEKVMSAVADDSTSIDTALVYVGFVDNSTEYFCQFIQGDFDSTFEQSQYRPSCNFIPKAGEICSIECSYLNLPVLHAQTIIPQKAELIGSTLLNSDQQLYFELQKDSSIYMFDIYVFSNNTLINYLRLPASQSENTLVNFNSVSNIADSLIVFSYDYNMAKYYLSSNISLNFNKYRETYSTVENGYGVFGSLNKVSFVLNK